jgi:hypothetical protein
MTPPILANRLKAHSGLLCELAIGANPQKLTEWIELRATLATLGCGGGSNDGRGRDWRLLCLASAGLTRRGLQRDAVALAIHPHALDGDTSFFRKHLVRELSNVFAVWVQL